jgi:hypothetical protein
MGPALEEHTMRTSMDPCQHSSGYRLSRCASSKRLIPGLGWSASWCKGRGRW